jgi:lactoylglutathione lyase
MSQPQQMSLRLELFVGDLETSIAFYCDILGFDVQRREADYTSLRCGTVILGLGPIAKLPLSQGYFTQHRLQSNRGAGVEIVLDVEDIHALYTYVQQTSYPITEPLMLRPWGLTDFRLADPDGYYLRLTSRQ